MQNSGKAGPQTTVPPVYEPSELRPRRSFGKWRAFSLSLVYVVFAIHIIHWKISGKTLAPLELNEVMYTLELGIITAGFLFMCLLILGALIFGRFFCSWACHIMVLQDLCAWILRKFHIRRKPIRSRLLLFVPPLTALYMFVWPQIKRTWHTRAFPEFKVLTDASGWASFVTDNFWRNLPSAPIIILTFLVCGFLIVYLLGTRSFCAYVCPYGAIFGLGDRLSPGRIRVNPDKCVHCARCTAACTTGIPVHEEHNMHGMIVNPACLKDLDCVSVCPHGALSYGFSKPALFKSYKSGGRFGLPFEFSLAEDVLMGFVFLAVLLSFRSLYSRIPFLLSLALGGIIGYLTVLTVRLFFQWEVKLATVFLRRDKRLTLGGRVFLGFMALLTLLVAHSAFVRYHEYSGLTQARALRGAEGSDDANAQARSAHAHLLAADRWGFFRNERVERNLVRVASKLEEFDDVDTYAGRLLDRYPSDASVRLQLGQSLIARKRLSAAERQIGIIVSQWQGATDDEAPPVLASAHQILGTLLAQRGEFAAAAGQLRACLARDPSRAPVHAELGGMLAELGQLDEAVAALRMAVQLDPDLPRAHYNLGTLLAFQGRYDQAIPAYEQALAVSPDDTDIHSNLGFALWKTGDAGRAQGHLERAIALNPDNAAAHFTLGGLLESEGKLDEAAPHYRLAARLDPRYARFLNDRQGD